MVQVNLEFQAMDTGAPADQASYEKAVIARTKEIGLYEQTVAEAKKR